MLIVIQVLSFISGINYILIKCVCFQTEDEPAMSEMVESTITSHTYVAHVPVPSQKEVICMHYKCLSDRYIVQGSLAAT